MKYTLKWGKLACFSAETRALTRASLPSTHQSLQMQVKEKKTAAAGGVFRRAQSGKPGYPSGGGGGGGGGGGPPRPGAPGSGRGPNIRSVGAMRAEQQACSSGGG